MAVISPSCGPSRRQIWSRGKLASNARRYLHVFGPATAASFARWAGLGLRDARVTIEALAGAALS
jgi:hypothetical protein